ncbi:MAG: response regulator [Candidatus Nitrosotenuis sp.]|nr:MAG: response regulator [Candidatus Nitrosotenuis sp.]
MAAYNQFTIIAESLKKTDSIKAALSYVLAAECKIRQNKDSSDEITEAGKLYFGFAKKENTYGVKNAYLCAAKCFLRAGRYDDAKTAFEKSKTLKRNATVESLRPVMIVDDSKSIILKIENYLEKLGYKDTHSFTTGKEALSGYKKLLKTNPIILLDMGLPDINGDVVANKILSEKPDAQIIVITADEKSTKRVKDTISVGVLAFIQKPFTIKDLKDALNVAESENSLSKK